MFFLILGVTFGILFWIYRRFVYTPPITEVKSRSSQDSVVISSSQIEENVSVGGDIVGRDKLQARPTESVPEAYRELRRRRAEEELVKQSTERVETEDLEEAMRTLEVASARPKMVQVASKIKVFKIIGLCLSILLVALIIVMIGLVHHNSSGEGGGAGAAAPFDWKKLLLPTLYFVVMLAGMAGEYMFGLKRFKDFTVSEFARPFWVSLIIFGVPWAIVDRN
jgi:hypothetical protein